MGKGEGEEGGQVRVRERRYQRSREGGKKSGGKEEEKKVYKIVKDSLTKHSAASSISPSWNLCCSS